MVTPSKYIHGRVKLGDNDRAKAHQRGPASAAASANHFVPSGESVEVDVVAQEVARKLLA